MEGCRVVGSIQRSIFTQLSLFSPGNERDFISGVFQDYVTVVPS